MRRRLATGVALALLASAAASGCATEAQSRKDEEAWRNRGAEGYYGGGTIHSNSFPETFGRYGYGPYGRPMGYRY